MPSIVSTPQSPGEVSRCAQTRVGGDNEFDRAVKTCMLRGLNLIQI